MYGTTTECDVSTDCGLSMRNLAKALQPGGVIQRGVSQLERQFVPNLSTAVRTPFLLSPFTKVCQLKRT